MKMYCVYILFSLKSNKFYIGETPGMASRLAFHNDVNKNTNSTKSGIPWDVFFFLEVENRIIARRIETHIKKMKSKKYLENLKKYPEISQKLIEKYTTE